MRLNPLRCTLRLMLLLTALLLQQAYAANPNHVLILNSYHQGMDWTDGETAGVKSSLEKSNARVELHIEYMDAKRLVDKAHFDNLRRLFAHKYQAIKLSAIVVTDNDAFDFMRRYRDELFPGVPVVFCGINRFQDKQIAGHAGFTGVAETVDTAATIELMLRLHPDTQRIVVAIDNTTTGKVLLQELEPVMATFKDKVKFVVWNTLTPNELGRQVATLPSNNLILLMPYASDQAGNFISYAELAKLVTESSPVPVYAAWDFYLGHGVVGGLLTTATAQGAAAGEMLVRILAGERVSNIPVRHQIPGHYLFDYRQLARFNIPQSRLPEYSKVMFQPWHQNNQMLLLAGGFVALTLIALLWALLTSLARKRQADAALHANMTVLLSHFSALSEISQGVMIAGLDRHITYANRAIERISGYTQAELLGHSCKLLHGPNTSEETKKQIREALNAGQAFHGEILNYRKDGTPFWNALAISPVFDTQGKLTQFVGIQNDITQRKQAEVELQIAAKAFESQVAMLVTDAQGVILRVNQAFTRATGYTAEEAIGKKTSLLRSGRHDTAFYQQLWAALRQQYYWQGVIWNRRKNGGVYAEWLTINAVVTPAGEITHYVSAFSDITQNKEAEAEVHRLAYYDQLTQLPNRRLLQDRLGQAIVAAAGSGLYGAVLFLDLDNFNTLNDTRGHATGDLLLIQVAQRLRQALRQVDTLARLGGDEFVIILQDLSANVEDAAASAKLTGEQLGAAIAQPYQLDGQDYLCSVSIGICLFHGEETLEQLQQNADIAMYQAKSSGRNSLRFFDPEMQAALDKRSILENDLRQALTRDELILYYQPQVDHVGRIVGAEILLRWNHPEYCFTAPAEFIPLAEETGLILSIGHWVMEGACKQIKIWADETHFGELIVSVNVSPLQFRQESFVESIRKLLDEYGIAPTRLRLELTETLLLEDIENSISKMHALKQLGITFSMDDFGTGFSSLSYLQRLPLDELKIDKSFVSQLPGNRNDEIIAQTIITMGKSLGLSVIAEGVETEAQHAFLDQHGCHAFQGFLYGAAVPVKEFMSMMQKSKA